MLLAAVVLPLDEDVSPTPTALQGWFYGLLRQADASVHDVPGFKPFTVAYLGGARPAVRLTFLDGDLHARLSPLLWDLIGSEIQLGVKKARIKAVLEAEHPWAGLWTYPRLFRGGISTDYPMLFRTPTFFKRKDAHYPLPEPRLVFGSLLSRFQHFSPVSPPKNLHAVFDRLTFRTYRLRTRSAAHEVPAPGFVGHAVFHLPRAEEEEARWVSALWRFSFFSGVGAKTTMGFGLTRPLPLKGETDAQAEPS